MHALSKNFQTGTDFATLDVGQSSEVLATSKRTQAYRRQSNYKVGLDSGEIRQKNQRWEELSVLPYKTLKCCN